MSEVKKESRIKKWIRSHPEISVAAAQAGVIVGVVLMGYGLSRTFRADAEERLKKADEKINKLEEENLALLKWFDAQTEAGVEFKRIGPEVFRE